MSWYKEILADIAVTFFIFLTVVLEAVWMIYVLIGYTFLMLIVTIVFFFNENFLKLLKTKKRTAPKPVVYQLYGINIAILLLFGWWVIAFCWLVIGFLFYLTDKKIYGS